MEKIGPAEIFQDAILRRKKKTNIVRSIGVGKLTTPWEYFPSGSLFAESQALPLYDALHLRFQDPLQFLYHITDLQQSLAHYVHLIISDPAIPPYRSAEQVYF